MRIQILTGIIVEGNAVLTKLDGLKLGVEVGNVGNVHGVSGFVHMEISEHPVDIGDAVPFGSQVARFHIHNHIVPFLRIGNEAYGAAIVVGNCSGSIYRIFSRASEIGTPAQVELRLTFFKAAGTVHHNGITHCVRGVGGTIVRGIVGHNPGPHITVCTIRHQMQMAGRLKIHSLHQCGIYKGRVCLEPTGVCRLGIAGIDGIVGTVHSTGRLTVEQRRGSAAAVGAALGIGNISGVARVGELEEHTIVQKIVDFNRPADGVLGVNILRKTGVTGFFAGGDIAHRREDTYRHKRHDHRQYQQQRKKSAADAMLFHKFFPFRYSLLGCGSCRR